MAVLTMYRSATQMTTLTVLDLGDITSWGASDWHDNCVSEKGGVNVSKFTTNYGAKPGINALNNIDFGTTATVNLYASKTLHYGCYVGNYNTTFKRYERSGLQTSGTANMFISVRRPGESVLNSTYLARATISGTVYIGIFVYNVRNNQVGQGGFYTNSGVSAGFLNEAKIKNSPVESETITDPIGGDRYAGFNFEGDDIALPDAPDETVSGVLASGFLNIYKPSDNDLRTFGGALWTNAFNVKWTDIDSVSNLVLNAVSNPIDFIIGLFMLPVTPDSGGESGIFLGGINVNTVSAPRVTKQYKVIDFGTLAIAELYANYLDYSNSRVSIYLPYVGTADIDVQEITGGAVHLQYIVDCFTGACVANVQCVKVTPAPWGTAYTNKTVHSYSGNMAIQLPISAGSFDTLTQGLINVGLGLGSNTPAMMLSGAKDVVQGFAGDVTTRGSLSSNTGKLGYQTPYLMFTRPIESRPANLGELHGYSSGVGGVLSQFSGYVECNDVKLDGVTATDSELNEIESILKSGVYV